MISSHILTELAEICHAAVIIERGNLLMAGAIGDLLTNSAPHRTVLIRALEGQERLYRELLETPRVGKVNLAGEEVVAEIDGDEQACYDILATLIHRGYRVVEFRQQRANLEEIFMNVTKGATQ